MRIVFIAGLLASHPKCAIAKSAPPPLHLHYMLGNSTVAGCFKPRSLPDYDFATHTIAWHDMMQKH
jgi:hypothetical protein